MPNATQTAPFALNTDRYAGIQNIGEATYIYSHANVYAAHGTIMRRKNAEYVLESHPEWLDPIDQGVIEKRVESLVADARERGEIGDDSTQAEVEAVFLHRVFPMFDDAEDIISFGVAGNTSDDDDIIPVESPAKASARTNAKAAPVKQPVPEKKNSRGK